VAITSAEPGEGKSTVVANLAAAIAEQGRRVVVVDADLRAPTQHILLGVSNESGLSLVLAAKASWDEVTRDTSVPGLAVIPSGPVTAEAFELIAPHRMASLLAELRRWFDFIVVDTPSLLAVADAVTLAPIVDEVVLVAACGRVRAETARAARHQLLRAGATSVSVIANRVAASPSFDYYQARRAA
jgi:capsular exopolysaccharide synthesis family protein